MQIPQNIIDEVVERADIVDVLGKHLKLKRSGQNYFACCPFHNEKSPSFMVNEEKQFWHCFGCQKSGDIFAFVMEMEGVEFREALKTLAEKHTTGFDGLFADLKGDVLVAQGKTAEAKVAYKEALEKLDAQGHLIKFTQHKLEALGN